MNFNLLIKLIAFKRNNNMNNKYCSFNNDDYTSSKNKTITNIKLI